MQSTSTPIFSQQDVTSLFGAGLDPEFHLRRLQAADSFFQIWKEIDRSKTTLKMLTPRSFGKRNKSLFIRNLENVLKTPSSLERRALLPLIQDDIDGAINQFIFACFALSGKSFDRLEKHGLMDLFPQLFRGIVGDCIISTDIWIMFMTLVENTCDGTIEVGKQLLDAIAISRNKIFPFTSPHEPSQETSGASSHPSNSQPQITEDLGSPTTEGGRGNKRHRLNHSSDYGNTESLENGEQVEPLVFQPEDLAMIGTESFNEAPPLNSKKTFQFCNADTDRFESLFGGHPVLQAIKSGRQWNWERLGEQNSQWSRGQTNCIVALFSEYQLQDISFVIRVGYRPGVKMIEYLQFHNSEVKVLGT